MDVHHQPRKMGIPPDLIATAQVDGKPIAEAEKPRAEAVAVEACPHGTMRIVIPGPPPGKPRMTQRDKWLKRPCVVRYRNWCDRVREAVGDSLPAAENVAELNWTAYFEPPVSWKKSRRVAAMGTRHRSKPDVDNCLKGIMDCLWPKDDSGIADVACRKRWDWTARLEVEIVVGEFKP